ncbi:MAG: ribose 5-phosphate isomerase A [Candidatus Tokpelaia sp. JSC161]|jgi:ribose 5-phosphate isomerase A|nr:MAG: ribose 5-phosphate isomerase A [Candidatus Tokpelaia sp. JSC161]
MLAVEKLKIAVAEKALNFVRSGMRLGIGTGSTAEEFIRLLSIRVAQGLLVYGVATSERSALLCREFGIFLKSLEEMQNLDLTVDGADEIGPGLSLIKGGGGALVREKIVAAASKEMLVIADYSKVVDNLGAFPLPIEVNIFGFETTRRAIRKVALMLGLEANINLRKTEERPFVTDNGNFILDASLGPILNPESLSARLLEIPGVVDHGLFLQLASRALIACEDGRVELLAPSYRAFTYN